jgi:hypothetical protein
MKERPSPKPRRGDSGIQRLDRDHTGKRLVFIQRLGHRGSRRSDTVAHPKVAGNRHSHLSGLLLVMTTSVADLQAARAVIVLVWTAAIEPEEPGRRDLGFEGGWVWSPQRIWWRPSMP